MPLVWVLVEACMYGSDLIVVCVGVVVCGGWYGRYGVVQCVLSVCMVWFVLVWIGLVDLG